jgi:hypothetical protein
MARDDAPEPEAIVDPFKDEKWNRKLQKPPTLKTTQQGFWMWWMEISSWMVMSGLKEVMQTTRPIGLPAKENQPHQTLEENRLTRMNEIAIAYLAYIPEEKNKAEILMIIEETKTEDWPTGLAYQVMAELKKRYKPNDHLAQVTLMKELNQLRHKSRENPKKLFTKLAELQALFQGTGKRLTVEEICTHLLRISPEKYREDVAKLIDEHGDKLTLQQVRDKYMWRYRFLKKDREDDEERSSDEDDDDEEGEEALAAVTRSMQKRVLCYNCGKKGHKSFNCPKAKAVSDDESSSESDNDNRKRCQECKKKGHKTDDCWNLEKNKKKRPEWFKPSKKNGKERANMALDDKDNDEFFV